MALRSAWGNVNISSSSSHNRLCLPACVCVFVCLCWVLPLPLPLRLPLSLRSPHSCCCCSHSVSLFLFRWNAPLVYPTRVSLLAYSDLLLLSFLFPFPPLLLFAFVTLLLIFAVVRFFAFHCSLSVDHGSRLGLTSKGFFKESPMWQNFELIAQ